MNLLLALALAAFAAEPSCPKRPLPKTPPPDDRGPAWTLARDPKKPHAVARVPRGGTLAGLAAQLGLEADRIDCWLGVDGELRLVGGRPLELAAVPLDAPLEHLPPQRVRVPNAVVAAWMGDFGEVGRESAEWESDLAYLRALGFKVELWEAGNGKETLRTLIKERGADKSLHGFFSTAHGTCEGVGQSGRHELVAEDFALRYLLPLVIVNACYADFAEALGAKTPGAALHAPEELTRAVFETRHPDELLKGGAQGTRRARAKRRTAAR